MCVHARPREQPGVKAMLIKYTQVQTEMVFMTHTVTINVYHTAKFYILTMIRRRIATGRPRIHRNPTMRNMAPVAISPWLGLVPPTLLKKVAPLKKPLCTCVRVCVCVCVCECMCVCVCVCMYMFVCACVYCVHEYA